MDGSVPAGGNLAEYDDLLELILQAIEAVDVAAHFGVKGMKWGVRKSESSSSKPPLNRLGPESITRKTASGKSVTLTREPSSSIANFLAKHSRVVRRNVENNVSFKITDAAGKTIGDAQVTKINSSELNLVWLGIKGSERGQGYATAVVKAGAEFGRKAGFKKLTLEVPGHSPDARHIYEKMGFKVDEVQSDRAVEAAKDPYWGGLTSMTLDVNSKAAHSEDLVTDFLEHYGVKGMKWGVRTKGDREPASSDAVRTRELNSRARVSGRDALSNQELQAAINRMNLEQQYDRLKPRSLGQKALRFVGQQLGIIAKEQGGKLAREAVGEAIKRARSAA